MKKLKLKKTNFAGTEVLSRAQLKKIMGGNGSTTSSGECVGTYFLVTSAGCGYRKCYGYAATTNPDPTKIDCICEDEITTPQPCNYA